MIKVKSYSKSKGNLSVANTNIIKQSGSASTITTARYAATAGLAEKVNKHTFWGNEYDGTQDVEGDIKCPGIYATDNIITDALVDCTSLVTDDITSTNTVTTAEMYTDTLTSTNTVTTQTLEVTGDATISGTLDVSDIATFSSEIDADGALIVAGQTQLKNDTYAKDIKPFNSDKFNLGESNQRWLNAYVKNGYFHNIDVTGKAYFKELQIDKITASEGNVIVSAGTYKVDAVGIAEIKDPEWTYWSEVNKKSYLHWGTDFASIDGIWTIKLYQMRTNDGKTIKSSVQKGDFIYLQEFNIDEGTSTNVSNKYFRGPVIESGTETVEIKGEQVDCSYIEVVCAYDYFDKSGNNVLKYWPEGNLIKKGVSTIVAEVETGDEISVLGSTEKDRQNAIIISAIQGLDKGIAAPSWAQYEEIDDWNKDLSKCRKTYFSASGNEVIGNLIVKSTGQLVEDYIDSVIPSGFETYLHVAYCNDASTGDGFIYAKKADPSTKYNYMGTCVNSNSEDTGLTYKNYTWTNISSTEVHDTIYKLVPVSNNMNVSTDGTLLINLVNQVWAITNKQATKITDTSTARVEVNLIHSGGIIANNATISGDYYTYTEYIPKYDTTSPQYQHAVIKLIVGGITYDTISLDVTLEAGAYLKVSKDIETRVQTAEGNISTLIDDGKTLTQRMTDAENNISEVTKTASSLSSTVSEIKKYEQGDNILPNYATDEYWTNTDFEKKDTETFQYTSTYDYFYTPPIQRTQNKYVFSWSVGVPYDDDIEYIKIYGSTEAYDSTKTFTDYTTTLLGTITGADIQYNNELKRWYIGLNISDNYNVFFIALYGGNSYKWVNPMLELGTIPHAYSLMVANNQSNIYQTANEIKLSVNETNLKLESGNITLNGNTVVNGSLSLNDDNIGFILHGKEADLQIIPNTITDYTTFKNQNVIYQDYSKRELHTTTTVIDPDNYPRYLTFEWTDAYNLGKFEKGVELKIDNFKLTAYGFLYGLYVEDLTVVDKITKEHPRRYENNPTVTAQLVDYTTGNIVYTVTRTIERGSTNTLLTYVTSAAYDDLRLNISFSSSDNLYTDWCGGRGQRKHDIICQMEGIYSFSTTLPKSKFGIIGSNGYGFNFGNRIIYATDNELHFTYGDKEWVLCDNVLNQNNRCNSRYFGVPGDPDKSGYDIYIDFNEDIYAEDTEVIKTKYVAISGSYSTKCSPWFDTQQEVKDYMAKYKPTSEYKIVVNGPCRYITYPCSVDAISIVSSKDAYITLPRSAYQGQIIKLALKVPTKYIYPNDGQYIASQSWGWSDDPSDHIKTTDRRLIEMVYIGNTWFEQ